MDIKAVKSFLANSWEDYKLLLAKSLQAEFPFMNQVNDYVMGGTGKQLRPMLALLTAKMISDVNEKSIKCAVASEMLHTATLLHDDVADNAEYRRGRKTVYSIFSGAVSVLVGDFWLSRAVRQVLETENNDIFECYVRTIEDLAEGEMLQLSKAEQLDTTYDDYISIISRKTSSLFIATIKSAAISAGATPEQVEAASNYAHKLGLAFQMRDDILDYSPQMNTGKTPGLDLLERKITIPLLSAFEQSTTEEIDSVKAKLAKIGGSESTDLEIVAQVYDFVKEKNGVEIAQHKLTELGEEAACELSQFEDNQAKEYLLSLIRFVCDRKV